jgi:hypothetical protein
MAAALVEQTGHSFDELMSSSHEDLLVMNITAIAISNDREERLENA